MSESFRVSDVEEILDLMVQWSIAEAHVTLDGAALDLVRLPARAELPLEAPAPLVEAAPEIAPEEEEPETVEIHAPAVGVFHPARTGFPDGAPRAGDQVQAGQTIGAIELMHVPNDLISPVSGIIEEILADDGAGVEYGQPLMVIRPFEEVSEDEAGMLPPPR